MTIYSPNIFDGTLYAPAISATTGDTIDMVPVPTIWSVSEDREHVVACRNLASARAYVEGRVPVRHRRPTPTPHVNVTAYVSPSGQYYVMHGNQRMDVANAATARHYVRNGVPVSTMIAASLEDLNR